MMLSIQGRPQAAHSGPAAKPTPLCHPRQRQARPSGRQHATPQFRVAAATAQQLEGVTSWLAAAGVDVAKQAAVPAAGGGLVCSREVKKGEQLFAIPDANWITAQTAAKSEIGQFVAGLDPWLSIALLLLHERAKGSASRWAPYLATLPADSGSPVQWGEADLEALEGSQLLGTVQGYRAFFQQRYEQLQAELFGPNSKTFDPAVFTLDAFLWAACTVRARAHPPLDGANIALVPLADLAQHQRGANNAGWRVKQTGAVFGAGGSPSVVMEAAEGMAAGEAIVMDYGPLKTDGQLLVDHGVLDPLVNRAGFALTLELSEQDKNRDDKLDVLELNGLQQANEFVLRADAAVDPELLPTLRLLNLQGADTFLLESIFRNEVWEHMQLPVTEENEQGCYQQIIDGCGAALAAYPTSIDEDLALLAGSTLVPGSRLQQAVRVRLGEKEALDATLRFFEDRIVRLAGQEYYGERRLKRLGLLDDSGKSTWDGFFVDGIA